MVRYVRPDEVTAEFFRATNRGLRDVQRATGTEKARTRDSTVVGLLDEFATTLSPEVEPVAGWSPVPPAWVAGTFVWKRTITTYGDGSIAEGPALLVTGNDGEPGRPGDPGDPGDPGAPGDPGVGVASTTITYQAGTSGTTPPTGAWGSTVPTVPAGQFLWTRTVLTLTDSTSTTAYSAARMGLDGADGGDGPAGAPGVNATSITVGNEAAVIPATAAGATVGASTIVIPFAGWVGDVRAAATIAASGLPSGITTGTNNPATGSVDGSLTLNVAAGSTLGGASAGTITLVVTTNGRAFVVMLSWAKALAGAAGGDGAPGTPGSPGAPGVGVSTLTFFYFLSATQPSVPTVSPPPAPWTTTEPSPSPGETRSLWVTVRTILSSGAFSYAPVSASASFTAARDAFNKHTFSPNAPTAADGVGKPVGAMWVRKNIAGEIEGYWEWVGGTWQVRPLSQEIIPLIVAGMLSATAINGMTIIGATLATATSGQRNVFNSSGFLGYGPTGQQVAFLDLSTGGLTLTQDMDMAGVPRATLRAQKGFGASLSLYSPSGGERQAILQAETSGTFLALSGAGGNSASLDADTSTVQADVHKNQAGGLAAPYAMAAGYREAGAINAGAGATLTVTLPVGRFSVPPMVTANADSSRITVSANSITTAAFNIRADNWSPGLAGGPIGIRWQAVQMTSGAAAG